MTENANKDQGQIQLNENGQNVEVKGQNVEVEGQNVGTNVEMTTEQVINAVAARPSWKMALLWVGLMSFMAVGKNS